jgi:hypothetical protein
MSIEDMALSFEGFTPAQIAQIHAALPEMEYLANLVKANMTVINRVVPVLHMVISVVNAKQKELNS